MSTLSIVHQNEPPYICEWEPVQVLDFVYSDVNSRSSTFDIGHFQVLLTRLKRLMPHSEQEHFADWYRERQISYINSNYSIAPNLWININAEVYDSELNFIVGFRINEKLFVMHVHIPDADDELRLMFFNTIHSGNSVESDNHWEEFMEILSDYTDFFD